MDSKSLDYLLRGGHINMPDRISRCIWPHPPLHIDELICHIASKLETEKWFPHKWIVRKPGELIDDTGVIEQVTPNQFIYRTRRVSPVNLYVITEEKETIFSSAKEVISYYLKRELLLPGDLDGWKVIE